MTGSAKRRVSITGTGEATGGEYESIRIMGDAVLHGEIRCGRMKCVGNVVVRGGASAGTFRLQGEAAVEGTLQAGELTGLGQLVVKGNIRSGRARIRGMLIVEGLEADRLQVKGAFEVRGVVNAGHADIRLYGPSRVSELGGGTIRVGRSRMQSLKQWALREGPAVLSAELIEGDRLELSHTEAQVVRGNRVVLGPGCRIGTVEYGETLTVHKGSAVGNRIRTQM